METVTQTQLPTLRGLLESRIGDLRAELQAAAAVRDERVAASTSELLDQKDEVDIRQRREVDAQSERLAAADLACCEAALRRIDEGVYGDCVDCGEPIAPPRLKVRPQAERCHDCQEMHERASA